MRGRVRREHARTVHADHEGNEYLRGFLHEDFPDGAVLKAAPQLLFKQTVHLVELLEHQLAVVIRLHVAVGRTAHQNQPVGVGIDGEIQISLAEVQHPLAAVPAFVAGPLQDFEKTFENVHPGGQKKLFLIAVVMGQQPERYTGPLGNFLECGFRVPAFAEKLLGGLQQGLLLRHCGHSIPPKNICKKQRWLVEQSAHYATGFRSSTEKCGLIVHLPALEKARRCLILEEKCHGQAPMRFSFGYTYKTSTQMSSATPTPIA